MGLNLFFCFAVFCCLSGVCVCPWGICVGERHRTRARNYLAGACRARGGVGRGEGVLSLWARRTFWEVAEQLIDFYVRGVGWDYGVFIGV